MLTENVSNVSKNFNCNKCNYTCSKQSLWNKHILTAKHLNVDLCLPKISEKKYICECGKEYKYKQSIHVHKKKCSNNIILEKNQLTNVVVELIKQNQEFKDLLIEQNNKILELSQKTNNIQFNNSNNNTINNKFNLNFFLNEQCKDAMNIMDFANSLEIKIKELEDVGTLGYATGISNIIIRGLNALDIHKRPIHCSDLKREIIHIKDKDIWEQDKEKQLFITAIKKVARKNMMKVVDWKTENPDFNDLQSKTMDKYTNLLIEATGPYTVEDKEKNFNKIIRNVAKEVTIKK